jgi:hypothetical protein
MQVSIASFLPIIIVGPFSDLVGTTVVILVVATSILTSGIASVVMRGPLRPEESVTVADPHAVDPIAAALGADRPTWRDPALDREQVVQHESPTAAGGATTPDAD